MSFYFKLSFEEATYVTNFLGLFFLLGIHTQFSRFECSCRWGFLFLLCLSHTNTMAHRWKIIRKINLFFDGFYFVCCFLFFLFFKINIWHYYVIFFTIFFLFNAMAARFSNNYLLHNSSPFTPLSWWFRYVGEGRKKFSWWYWFACEARQRNKNPKNISAQIFPIIKFFLVGDFVNIVNKILISWR